VSEILAEVHRNRTVESVHCGSIAVSDKDGNVLFYHGDANLITYTRSSAKAFQFLPVYESGAVKRFGFSQQQIAIMLGSHTGTPLHEQTTKANLDLIGLDESYLKCGTHVPIDYQMKGYIPHEGQEFSQLAHNCSGKHSGQLALALQIGDDPKNYIDPDSKTQQLVRQTVAEAYDYPIDKIQMGTDGCSLPNFALPLKNMAKAYAMLVTKSSESALRREAYQTVISAMQQHPNMVSGPGRCDLAVTEACKGDVILKIGGEAIEVIGVLSKGLGIAIKISDGNPRALYPVIVETLRQIGALDDSQAQVLAKFTRPRLHNFRNLHVGEILPCFTLRRG
jgi:L-asparaginase II